VGVTKRSDEEKVTHWVHFPEYVGAVPTSAKNNESSFINFWNIDLLYSLLKIIKYFNVFGPVIFAGLFLSSFYL